jgi:SAM-dependent methyltransferase
MGYCGGTKFEMNSKKDMDLICPHCGEGKCTVLWAAAPTRIGAGLTRDIGICPICAIIVPETMSTELQGLTSVEKTNDVAHNQKISIYKHKFPDQYVFDKVSGLQMPKEEKLASVLDIGCQQGGLLRVFEKQGFRAVGLEPEQTFVDIANDNGIDVHAGMFPENVPSAVADAKFSIIAMFEAIYYLGSMDEVFSWSNRHLLQGGYLVIKSLNGGSPRLVREVFFDRVGDVVTGVPQLPSLLFFAKRHGFRIVDSGNIPDDILVDRLGIPLRRGKTFVARIVNRLLPWRKADRNYLIAQKL